MVASLAVTTNWVAQCFKCGHTVVAVQQEAPAYQSSRFLSKSVLAALLRGSFSGRC